MDVGIHALLTEINLAGFNFNNFLIELKLNIFS